MKLSKFHLIALLVGTVAVVGCKDEGGTGGTGGTAGTGGTGGGIDTGCDKGRCLDEAQATKCDEEILACIAAELANETACTVFGNVLLCSEGGTGGTGGMGGMGGEGGTGGAIDVSCDEGRCVDDDAQATKCEEAILACIAAKPANEEQCVAIGNLVFCDEGVLVPVFVTRGDTNGNLGALASGDGLAGGDSFCTEAATTADLPGLWTAWLSTSPNGGTGVAAIDRISAGKYVRLDATVVAENPVDLTDGTLAAPINVQEDVTEILGGTDDRVWTGTSTEGDWRGATNCFLWTSDAAAGGADAQTGQANAVDEAWTDAIPLEITCDNTHRLYCFADTGSN